MLLILAFVWLTVCRGEPSPDDSLQGALDAINRRQRDLDDPTLYYLEHFHSPRDLIYPHHVEGDGQPEDIGYGYQKSFAPNIVPLFETIPFEDLGIHAYSPIVRSMESDILDFIEGNSRVRDPHSYQRYQTQNQAMKRSVFRERDVNELPSLLQNLNSEGGNSNQYFENGEHSQEIPSSFRERLASKIARKHPESAAHSLVRNFGGLDRDSDRSPENEDDSDNYLTMLNSIWDKYQHGNSETADPEELTSSDVEEMLEYINQKEEKKRQNDNYENGYDFFNAPLAWTKRNNPKHPIDQSLLALKLLNSHYSDLERSQEMELADKKDLERLFLDQQLLKNYNTRIKRFWRGSNFDDRHKNAKRYLIAKRSPSSGSPGLKYHKVSPDSYNQRQKKNAQSNSLDNITDPRVAKELNDIFSPPKENSNSSKNMRDNIIGSSTKNNYTKMVNLNETKSTLKNELHNQEMAAHMKRKRSGQKEEPGVDAQHKPMTITKKSVDWSNYFGIDKRQKKSTISPGNNEWLLNHYLKAYLISDRTGQRDAETVTNKSDDMDQKLQAMEDMIVDQALKFTGAHEGITDPEEVNAVSYRVMSQLLAAFSLEKMREALKEFKSSIAVEQASQLTRTTISTPTDAPDHNDEKRVAFKKEKAELTQDEKLEKKEKADDNEIHSGHERPLGSPEEELDPCPTMDHITRRCQEIAVIAGDTARTLVPMCTLHQICYLCGPELATSPRGCDTNFLLQAPKACGDTSLCRYLVQRTIAAMHAYHGDPSPLGCDWLNQPCLTRYLAMVPQ